MSRVLLVDTNLASWPIYQALQAQGHEVFVVGSNPQDYLANAAPNYIKQDYSDRAQMESLIEKQRIDHLVPGCNDFSYKVCADLSEQLGFTGIDSVANTSIINNKQKFRRFSQGSALPVPALVSEEEALDCLPIIVKPVDAYSGRGVTVIRDKRTDLLDDAIRTAKHHSRTGEYLLEQYVDGQLLSHSAFLVNKEILLDFFVEEHCIASPFAVDTSRLVTGLPDSVMQRVRDAIVRMASLLNLGDGLIHTQFILQDEDVWIVEITRRCPGDLYNLLIEYSTGFEYARMYAMPFLGQPLSIAGEFAEKLIVRHTMTVPSETRFTAIAFKRAVSLAGFFSLARSGELMAKAPLGRIGIFFTQSQSRADQQAIYNDLIRRELYVIQ